MASSPPPTGSRQLWTDAFLAALAETGSLSKASALAGIDRTVVFRRRQADPEFQAECETAFALYADRLEEEAQRRAVEGVEEDVYHQGEVVGRKRVYSDGLLTVLLKGRRRGVFGDRTEVVGANGGPVQHAVVVVTGVPPSIDDLV